MEDKNKKRKILKQISRGRSNLELLKLKELDGQELIISNDNAKTIFKSFNNLILMPREAGLRGVGVATPKTPVLIYESPYHDSWVREMFLSLRGTWEQKCLSQNQIIEFCRNSSVWIRSDCSTFFLCKKDEGKPIDENNPQANLCVVYVEMISGSFSGGIHSINYEGLCLAEHRHRVVAPKPKT